MYIELSPEHVRVYGGLYMLDSKQLAAVRSHISQNLKKFQKLYGEAKFKKAYGSVRGEQHKRVPKEFAEAIETEPLLLNKQFYYFSEEKPSLIAKEELTDVMMAHYKSARPMSKFLWEALS